MATGSSPIADGLRAAVATIVLLGVVTGVGTAGAVAGGDPDGMSEKSPGMALTADENATLEGTVTYENGTPVPEAMVLVVAGDRPMLVKMTTTELVELANNEASDEVFVARTNDEGQYSVSLPDGTYRTIALQDRAASGIETVDLEENEALTLDLTLQEYRPLTVRARGGTTSPGNETTVRIELYNNGASPVEDLSFALDGVPNGWTIVDHADAEGTFDEERYRWTWSSVPVGSFAEPSVTLQVPDDAALRNYTVTVVPESRHRSYDTVTATVRVQEPPKSGKNPTYVGGDGWENTTEPGSTIEPGGTTQTTNDGGMSGLGVTVALVALVLAIGAGVHSRQRP